MAANLSRFTRHGAASDGHLKGRTEGETEGKGGKAKGAGREGGSDEGSEGRREEGRVISDCITHHHHLSIKC